MTQIQCQKCRKIIQVPDNWDRNAACSSCGGNFQELSQNLSPHLQNQFQGLGNQLSQSFPHVYLGSGGITAKKPAQLMQSSPPQQIPQQSQGWEHFPYPNKQEKTYAKIREIALYICIVLVVGYAVYQIFF